MMQRYSRKKRLFSRPKVQRYKHQSTQASVLAFLQYNCTVPFFKVACAACRMSLHGLTLSSSVTPGFSVRRSPLLFTRPSGKQQVVGAFTASATGSQSASANHLGLQQINSDIITTMRSDYIKAGKFNIVGPYPISPILR